MTGERTGRKMAGWRAADTDMRCGRCRMVFRGGPAADTGGVEFLRCPDCGRRFWADPGAGADGRCAVGLIAAGHAATVGQRP